MAITYGKSFKTGSQVVKCTPAMLNAALDSAAVAEVCEKFKNTQLSYESGEIGEGLYKELIKQYKETFKPTLPFITPHACEYIDGTRRSDNAKPSGLAMLDVDHVDADNYWSRVKDRLAELHIVMAHRTPSYRGFRLIYELPEGMTIAESQMWMAKKLDTTYDTTTKDLARTSLLVPRQYVYYLDEDGLFKDRTVTWDVVGQESRDKGQESRDKSQQTTVKSSMLSQPQNPQNKPQVSLNLLTSQLQNLRTNTPPFHIPTWSMNWSSNWVD